MVPSKIVCVGRNYVEHVVELKNEVPTEALIFIKPSTSLRELSSGIDWNKSFGQCDYECELSLLISKKLDKNSSKEERLSAISHLSLGLDLTLRDLQSSLKKKGHPWEKAKAFDGSCLFGEWVSIGEFSDLSNIEFKLEINKEVRQIGHTSLMIFKVEDILNEILEYFSLNEGDIIMTGTPSGVSGLKARDELTMKLKSNDKEYSFTTWVI